MSIILPIFFFVIAGLFLILFKKTTEKTKKRVK